MKWYQRVIQRLIKRYLIKCCGAFKAGKHGYIACVNNDEYHKIMEMRYEAENND